MFRLTLPRIAHKAISSSSLPLGVGNDEKYELDMSALQEMLDPESKIAQQ
jgi:hypothetical protein